MASAIPAFREVSAALAQGSYWHNAIAPRWPNLGAIGATADMPEADIGSCAAPIPSGAVDPHYGHRPHVKSRGAAVSRRIEWISLGPKHERGRRLSPIQDNSDLAQGPFRRSEGCSLTARDRSPLQSAGVRLRWRGQNQKDRNSLNARFLANLRIEPCQPAMEYKSEMPLPFVLHFASRAFKPLWVVLARLHARKSWRPSGTILKKHKDTWLKFGSCIKKL